MASTMVTVSGTEPEAPPPAPDGGSRGGLLAIGALVAGVLLGALFTGNGPAEDEPTADTTVEEPTATPTTSPPLTTTTTEVVQARLATMVPGMLDVLVAGAVNRNSTQVVTTWEPSGRAPTVETLPLGVFVSDSTATWLASGTPNRWVTGATLWVGNTAHMEPVTSDLASGPVWHTRFPGELAWLESTPEGRVLKAALFVAGQPATPREFFGVDDTVGLVSYSEAGFLTARSGPGSIELELRNAGGEVEATREIVAGPLGFGPDLMLVIDLEGNQILLNHDLDTVAAAPWAQDCGRAAWGPNGPQVAVLCGFGDDQRFEYWRDPISDSEPTFTQVGDEFGTMGFTTNGIPFVATIESLRPSSTIIFYVAAEDRSYEVAYPGLVQWLVTVRS